jgi:hypothetical protein
MSPVRRREVWAYLQTEFGAACKNHLPGVLEPIYIRYIYTLVFASRLGLYDTG